MSRPGAAFAQGEDARAIERFLEALAAEAGAARNTLLAYGTDLRAASAVLEGRLAEAGADDLARLGEEWATLARATIARKSAALRRFYRFLVDEGDRASDPSAALPRGVVRRPLPKVLSHADVDRLFEVLERRAADPGRPEDLRAAALV
ncbi:MAG TPA: site-specific integrase, partial [Sphingomonas sp.]